MHQRFLMSLTESTLTLLSDKQNSTSLCLISKGKLCFVAVLCRKINPDCKNKPGRKRSKMYINFKFEVFTGR